MLADECPKPVFGMNRGTVGFLMNEWRLDRLPERIAAAKAIRVAPLDMAPDRRIDANGRADLANAVLKLGQFLIESLTHSVQALELEFSASSKGFDDANRVGVVRREGRVDHIARRKQALGAGDVGDVGRDLSRVDGIIVEASDLRRLDLGIPIGALDQTDHGRPWPGAR